MANAYLATLIAALNSADNDDLQKLRQALGGVEGERQTVLALLASVAAAAASGIPILPPTLTAAAKASGTTSPTPTAIDSLLVVFSSDFTGTFDGRTIDVKQSPSIAVKAPYSKTLPAYAITTVTGSFAWFSLT